jgi:hypothetical protein
MIDLIITTYFDTYNPKPAIDNHVLSTDNN